MQWLDACPSTSLRARRHVRMCQCRGFNLCFFAFFRGLLMFLEAGSCELHKPRSCLCQISQNAPRGTPNGLWTGHKEGRETEREKERERERETETERGRERYVIFPTRYWDSCAFNHPCSRSKEPGCAVWTCWSFHEPHLLT